MPLRIRNQECEKFRGELERIKYRGYEVEQISDRRKIVITKSVGDILDKRANSKALHFTNRPQFRAKCRM